MKNGKFPAILAIFCLCFATLTAPAGCGKKAPNIDSISPENAKAGETVRLTGKDFGVERGGGVVKFGTDESSEVATWSDTRITCKIPESLKPGKYDVSIKNNAGEESNKVSYAVKGVENGAVIDDASGNNHADEEVEKEETEDENVERAEDVENCKSVMIGYAQQNSEPGIEFSIDRFWMNEEGTEAEAILDGVQTAGPDKGEELEPAGIKAKKEDGRWVVTDFGTGIKLEHL